MAEAGSSAPGVSPEGAIGAGASSEIDYRRFAGQVLFPRSPGDLTNTSQCPACQSVLGGTTCRVCQLDLAHPASAELATLSRDAATLLYRRLEVIGRIRYDTAQALSDTDSDTDSDTEAAAPSEAREITSVRVDFPRTTPPPVTFPSLARTAETTPEPSPLQFQWVSPRTSATPPTGIQRRSSVQVILLIVGISLLSVAAVFFLVYAFINFGILGRSLIIAAVTIASFAVASILRRHSLISTAEGIAVLAVVLVYLDAFAIRANDFFRLGSVGGTEFWGATLVVTAFGFLAWHRLSGLRTPNIVGFSAIVPGVALVVGGANEGTDDGSRVFIALAAATLAGVVHHFIGRPATPTRLAFEGRSERLIVRGLVGVALLGAFVAAAAVRPAQPWASTPAFLVVAVLCALHAWLVGRASLGAPRSSAIIFAGIGGVAAAVSVWSGALRLGNPDVTVIAPPVAAAVAALGFELFWRRLGRGTIATTPHRRSVLTATIAAATVAAGSLVFPLAVAVRFTATAVSQAVTSSWAIAPLDELVHPAPRDGLAVIALSLCCVMLAIAWMLGGTLRRRAAIPAWFGVAVLMMAPPLLATLMAVFVGWLALAAATLATLLWADCRNFATVLRNPLVTLLALSGIVGYLVGWGSSSTWWIGSIVAITLVLAGRILPASPIALATALGAAAVVLLIGAAAAAHQLALPALLDPASDAENALRAVSIAAVALLALSAFREPGYLSSLDRRVIFWIGGAAAAASFGVLSQSIRVLPPAERISLPLPEPGSSLAANAALFAALLFVVRWPPASKPQLERVVASVALAPTLWLVVDAFARVIDLPELVRSVDSMSAALLAAVGVLVAAVLRADRSPGIATSPKTGIFGGDRQTREFGILLVALPNLIIGVARHDSVTWLMLVIAAIVALVMATSPDGLFRSVSPRRHLGWGALALATAGLWWRLGDSRVTDLEPYVLPLAGVLLLVALFVRRSTRTPTGTMPDRAAPVIVLAALLAAILPLGATAASGPLERALVVGGVSAILTIAGSTVVRTSGSRPYLDAMALAGALGVLTVVVGRSFSLSSHPGSPDTRLDAWLAAGLFVLLIAAFGQARERTDRSAPLRLIASQVMCILGLAITLGFELAALEPTTLGTLRAIAVILLFSALHVITFLVDRAPFARSIGWTVIAAAAVAVIGGLVTGALDPVELGTVPVAGALVLTGALSLSRTPTARSWRWLAPGVAVLLVPSLIATADQPPLWRLVGLGVVSVTIIVASAALRLQAPFLIAVVVVLIHAVATFAPQIRTLYESVEWWLWFVPVGIAVVVFAARFEKSVLRMRSVAMRIRALR